MKKLPPYRWYRNFTAGVAACAILASICAGFAAFFGSRTIRGDWGAAGQIAAVIPSFAGVLLAVVALIAYIREEDDVLKASEKAWEARNTFLFCSDALYNSIYSDAMHHDERYRYTRHRLTVVFPQMQKALLETDLGRAAIQAKSSGPDEKASIVIALTSFLEFAECIKNTTDETITSRVAESRAELNRLRLTQWDEQSMDLRPDELLHYDVGQLIRYWDRVSEAMAGLTSVSDFESLLREEYGYSFGDKILEMKTAHASLDNALKARVHML